MRSKKVPGLWRRGNGHFVNFRWTRRLGYGCGAPNLRPSTSPERLVETMSVPRKRTSYKQSITLNSSSMGRAGSLTLLISFVPHSLALVALLAVVVFSWWKKARTHHLTTPFTVSHQELRVESHMPTRFQSMFSLSPDLGLCFPSLPFQVRSMRREKLKWWNIILSPDVLPCLSCMISQFYHLLCLSSSVWVNPYFNLESAWTSVCRKPSKAWRWKTQ